MLVVDSKFAGSIPIGENLTMFGRDPVRKAWSAYLMILAGSFCFADVLGFSVRAIRHFP